MHSERKKRIPFRCPAQGGNANIPGRAGMEWETDANAFSRISPTMSEGFGHKKEPDLISLAPSLEIVGSAYLRRRFLEATTSPISAMLKREIVGPLSGTFPGAANITGMAERDRRKARARDNLVFMAFLLAFQVPLYLKLPTPLHKLLENKYLWILGAYRFGEFIPEVCKEFRRFVKFIEYFIPNELINKDLKTLI